MQEIELAQQVRPTKLAELNASISSIEFNEIQQRTTKPKMHMTKKHKKEDKYASHDESHEQMIYQSKRKHIRQPSSETDGQDELIEMKKFKDLKEKKKRTKTPQEEFYDLGEEWIYLK